MRPFVTVAVLLFASASVFAQAAKPCEDLKAEIAKKLDAKGVKVYSLDIVAKDADTDKDAEAKVVGTCEGGTKKIVYRRTAAPAQPPATPAAKP